MAPVIKRQIKLTLKEDGRIVDIIIPLYYVPEGMTLQVPGYRESPDNKNTTQITLLEDMEPSRDLDRVRG